jgi:cob(I)alamin adenosyltransferase
MPAAASLIKYNFNISASVIHNKGFTLGNRLSKIYTRTGDNGTTGLGDGSRVSKDSLRVQAMGDADELNSVIGIMITEGVPAKLQTPLTQIQHDLFNLGGEICMPGYVILKQARIDELESLIDTLNEDLSPLKEFILPGGTKAAAYCHLARTVCRRAERTLIQLHRLEPVTTISLQYLNRLSDLLFVMCRTINQSAGVNDVLWNNEHAK